MSDIAPVKSNELEISLVDIIQFCKKYFFLFVITAFCSGLIGYLTSYLFTKTYTATTILLPEYSTSKSSFFSLAMGANSSEGTGNLTPDLYPNILESTSFGEYLIKQPIVTQSGEKYSSLRNYFSRDTTISLMSRIKAMFTSGNTNNKIPRVITKVDLGNKDILNYTSAETNLINGAKSLVQTSIEQKNGLISIESEMTDPVVAAMLVEYAKKYLIDYVEDFRTAKLKLQLDFLTSRTSEAKKRQQNAEYALQSYRDNNRNAFLNVARIEEQRLQADYTLAQSIYSDLLIKQEQTKIKEKEERPVFKVLEPTKVPLDKSSPKRSYFFIFGALGGWLISLMLILVFKLKIVSRVMYAINEN